MPSGFTIIKARCTLPVVGRLSFFAMPAILHSQGDNGGHELGGPLHMCTAFSHKDKRGNLGRTLRTQS